MRRWLAWGGVVAVAAVVLGAIVVGRNASAYLNANRDWLAAQATKALGREVSFGTIELSLGSNPANGYSIVRAPHLDAAEQLLERCPIVESVSLYEASAPWGRADHTHPANKRSKQ